MLPSILIQIAISKNIRSSNVQAVEDDWKTDIYANDVNMSKVHAIFRAHNSAITNRVFINIFGTNFCVKFFR